jgi:hypothetical protein
MHVQRLQELTLEMTQLWISQEWGPQSTANFRNFVGYLLEELNRLPGQATAPT